jgi:hypothetical protein
MSLPLSLVSYPDHHHCIDVAIQDPDSVANEMDKNYIFFTLSVADPVCLSRFPDPYFYPSRVSDPGSNNSTKRGGGQKIIKKTFFS